jgi:hypothetical protein
LSGSSNPKDTNLVVGDREDCPVSTTSASSEVDVSSHGDRSEKLKRQSVVAAFQINKGVLDGHDFGMNVLTKGIRGARQLYRLFGRQTSVTVCEPVTEKSVERLEFVHDFDCSAEGRVLVRTQID